MTTEKRISTIDLNIPIAALSLGVFIWGIIMPMSHRQDDKIDRAIEGMRQDVNAIRIEMRDFHDRLVRIEEGRKT